MIHSLMKTMRIPACLCLASFCSKAIILVLGTAVICGGCGKAPPVKKTTTDTSLPNTVKKEISKQKMSAIPAPEPSPVAVLDKITELGGIYRLNDHQQVWALDFGHCAIHDDDLKLLYSLPEIKTMNLRAISDGGGSLSEAGLEPLRSLRKLERLDLSYNFFKVDLNPLKNHPRLTFLDLTSPNRKSSTFDNDALKVIATLPVLKKLRMANIICTEEGLRTLAGSSIEYLDYDFPGNFDIEALSGLKNLRRWSVQFRSFPSNRLAAFTGFSKLENLEISLTGEVITQAELNALASMKSLVVLQIGGRDNADWSFLKVIHQLPKLKSLQLSNAPDNVLELSVGSDSLEILCLRLSNIATEKGFAPLKTFTNLKKVSVDPEKLTADAFRSIATCESLQGLSFSTIHIDNRRSSGSKFQFENVDFTAEDMQVLFKKTDFQELSIEPVPFGDELLIALRPAENLKHLNISKSKVTNQGIASIRHFPQLERLSIYETEIDMNVIEKLHGEFFPQCYIGDNWCCGCLSIGPLSIDKSLKKEE